MAATFEEVAPFAVAITPVHVIKAHTQHDRGVVLHFEPKDAGDGSILTRDGASSNVAISWTLQSTRPDHLQLAEVDLGGQLTVHRATVEFGAPVLPYVGVQQHRIIALSAEGLLHSLELPTQGHQPLLQGMSITSLDIQAELQRLGQPMVLSVTQIHDSTRDVVLIGGSNGSLLVLPVGCVQANSAAGAFELHEISSRYLGFFGKSTIAPVVWASSLHPFSSELVCVVHQDLSMRFWNVRTRQKVSAGSLLQQSGQQSHLTPSTVGAVCNPQGHMRIVVYLQPKKGSSWQPQAVAVSMDLQQATDGSLQVANMRERLLEQSDTSLITVLTQQDTADPQTAHTWLLSSAPSLHAVSSSVTASKDEQLRTKLIDKQGLGKEADVQDLQDEIWHSVQQSLAQQSDQQAKGPLAAHSMQSLVAPGVLSQPALADALLELEEPLASDQGTLQEAQQHLTAAAQTWAAQHKCSEMASWRHVSEVYWKHWRQHHPALGLMPLPGGSVAIIRGGHMMTLLRKANVSSDLQQQGLNRQQLDSSSSDVQKLQQCVKQLQDLLGNHVLSLFVSLYKQASAELSPSAICNAFVEVLNTGPHLGNKQLQDHAIRLSLQAWRRERSAAIIQAGHLTSSMSSGTPVAALRAYLDLLQTDAQAAHVPSSISSSYQAGYALTVILRQSATQQLWAAAALLLIAWLSSIRAAGVLTISPTVSHVLQQEIVPQLQVYVRRTAIVQWLCTVPAAAQLEEHSSQSRTGQLHQQLANLDFASGRSRESAAQNQPLAGVLMSDFPQCADGSSVVQQPAEAAASLAAFFLAGCQSTMGPVPLTESALMQQVHALGLRLIQHRQMEHVHHLLTLAGPVADSAGCHFLKGFASLHQSTRGALGPQQAELLTQAAVCSLFQAANVFKAVNEAAHYGQQSHVAASRDLIRHVIQTVLTSLAGSYQEPAHGEEELQYFEALMLQCEQWGHSQAAAQFVQAARHEVEKVYADQNAPMAEQDRQPWLAQRHQREDRLCTNLFVYALEAGQYADAYNAVQANPTARGALSNLKRLVDTLMTTSNIATLCQLPYAAFYPLQQADGRCEVISLVEATQQLLEERAATAELGSSPQPYEVLYDFHCMRSNYKAAAAAQYKLAMRIREEGQHLPHFLDRIAAALLASVNALSMLEPSQQWLFHSTPLHQALQPPLTYQGPQQPSSSDPSMDPNSDSQAQALLSKCQKGIKASVLVLSSTILIPDGFGQYTDLTQQHAAAQAHATLVQLEPEAAYRPTVADEIYHRLLASGLFQAALELVVVLHQGLRLTQALEAALSAMATSCVQKQLDAAQDHATQKAAHQVFGHTPFTQGSEDSGRLRPDLEGLSPNAAWSLLLQTVQRYPTSQHGSRLYLAAVKAALSTERRLKLPAPLLAPFQASAVQQATGGMAGSASDPAALLAVYISYDRLKDAADLVTSHLAAYQKADVMSRQAHCQVWFPYNVIDSLVDCLNSTPDMESHYKQLQQALETHQKSTTEHSSTLLAGLAEE